MNLQTPIELTERVYKMYAKRLQKLGIKTLEDFLYHIPFRYENYSLISKIENLQAGETVTIQGVVEEIKNQYTRRFKTIQRAKIKNDSGILEVVWFNQPFITNYLHKNDKISLSGKVDFFNKKFVMQSPEYELMYPNTQTIHTGRFIPVYPETRGVSSKWLRRQIYKILQEHKKELIEYLPYSIIENHDLIGYVDAIEQIHFPKDIVSVEKAKLRLSFDELLIMQTSSLARKKEWNKTIASHPFSVAKFKDNIEEFWNKLPFKLTNAQNKAVKEIFADLVSKKPMNRLLEGDVGSGKTVVAAIAMYVSYLNGFQSVFMAPTEILANQHFNTISSLLALFGVKVELVTGSKKMDPSASSGGKWKILIGTHALLSKKINYQNLGLVVIDEQQRFGVEQRALMKQKGKNPHLLTMTATPIPRTVALTMYGDLDLSILDEMPIGRKRIKTWLVPLEKRENAYKWLEKQIKETESQAFIICPFIEESETMQTIKAATKEYEKLKSETFESLRLGLIHGKLKTKEKEKTLAQFKERKIDILVATPIVEVGIDIPNATIIVIEAAERFGLAQLHQLRGRVGRGEKQSYCLLFTESKSEKTLERLKAMETLSSGPELAELDLKLRGHGELYGTMQHGASNLKIASFSDFSLIEKTKKEAYKIFPKLSQHPLLLKKIKSINTKQVSPD